MDFLLYTPTLHMQFQIYILLISSYFGEIWLIIWKKYYDKDAAIYYKIEANRVTTQKLVIGIRSSTEYIFTSIFALIYGNKA